MRFLEPILILAKEHTPGNYFLIDEEEEQVCIRGAIKGLLGIFPNRNKNLGGVGAGIKCASDGG